MMGSIYSDYPGILLQSLSSMNEGYAGMSGKRTGFIPALEKAYLRLFGIPEIGYRIRGLYFRSAMRVIARYIRPVRALDVGSGIGNYVFDLTGLFPGARIDGWEIDRGKLAFTREFAKKKGYDRVAFSYGDITRLPKTSAVYDLLVNIDVLEHIKDYKTALRNMHRLLKPDGFLYLHTPQAHQKRFFKRFESWEHADHAREGFVPQELADDLRSIGFEIVEQRSTFGFFGSLAWELNHLTLSVHRVAAAIAFPFLYAVACLDLITDNGSRGLCTAIIARKKS